MVQALSFSGPASQMRDKVAALAESGVTEVVYQPTGPDVQRELEAFMDAVGSTNFDGPSLGGVRGRRLRPGPAVRRGLSGDLGQSFRFPERTEGGP